MSEVGLRHWLAALAVALLVHAAAAWVLVRTPPDPLQLGGGGGLQIGLAAVASGASPAGVDSSANGTPSEIEQGSGDEPARPATDQPDVRQISSEQAEAPDAARIEPEEISKIADTVDAVEVESNAPADVDAPDIDAPDIDAPELASLTEFETASEAPQPETLDAVDIPDVAESAHASSPAASPTREQIDPVSNDFLAVPPRTKPPPPPSRSRRMERASVSDPATHRSAPTRSAEVPAKPTAAQAKPAPVPRQPAGGSREALASLSPPSSGNGAAAPAARGQQGPRFQPGGPGNPLPEYPSRARRRGYEGRVILAVLVSADGAPLSVSVSKSSGHRILDEAALRAVRGWRFRPIAGYGASNTERFNVPIAFRLED